MADDLDKARQTMIDEHLRARGIHDQRVLAAMRAVPRERYLEPEEAALAYDDRALPIGCAQTISQPYIVALMTQALDVSPGMRVLEIGTGSGYQAAVLHQLGAEVYSVERHPQLAKTARQRLNLARQGAVHILVGDGRLGWPDYAPYDRVIITAAADSVPPAIWDQLSEQGLLVAPLGGAQQQTLEVVRKVANLPQRTPLISCRFVPLLPDVASA